MPDARTPRRLRTNAGTDVSAARVYDYLLGGSTNFGTDRAAAAELLRAVPSTRTDVWANRGFLRRAVGYLLDRGVRQFLDLGSGLPSAGNVHEIVQAADLDARVVYVDCDPAVVAHAEPLLAEVPGVTLLEADLRDVVAVLDSPEARRLLDFTRPIGLLAVAVLHFVSDCDDPASILAAYTDALSPGSYLVVSHSTPTGLHEAQAADAAQVYADTGSPLTLRAPDEVEKLFTGYRLVPPADDLPPGLAPVVPVTMWHPDVLDVLETQTVFGGVGILLSRAVDRPAARTG